MNTINNEVRTMAVIFMADGFEEVEAVTIADILRRAEIPTEIISIMGRAEVTGAHGMRLLCDSIFEESQGIIENADVLILPGGGEGAVNLKNHAGVGEALKQFNLQKKLLAAICAAPVVLAKHGILAGKTAICYPGFEDELDGAAIGAKEVIVSENVITAKAAGSAAGFAFKIVELLNGKNGIDGKKAAAEIKGRMFF